MLDLIYTGASNAHFHAICRRANWLPGIRSDKRPCAEATDIQFIDVRYTRPDFARHLAMVRRFRPRYATVPDLSEREVCRQDIRRALQQAELLAPPLRGGAARPEAPRPDWPFAKRGGHRL